MEERDFKINEHYTIDKEYANGGVVKLLEFGKHFCRVEDPDTGMIWETMLNRLSKIEPKLISDLK